MSVRSTVTYRGDKSCEVCHEPSTTTFLTDAPLDNNGLGRWISPTDLVGASMGSCMMTIMAMAAEKEKVDLSGSMVTVDKEMRTDPRRIGKLAVTFNLPAIDVSKQKKLETAALTCPVKQSLHPEVAVTVIFNWGSNHCDTASLERKTSCSHT
jgi:uncharacterized OsmC-like protein